MLKCEAVTENSESVEGLEQQGRLPQPLNPSSSSDHFYESAFKLEVNISVVVEPPQPAVACQQQPRQPPQGKEKPGMFIWKQGTRQAFGQISVDRRGGVNRSKDKTHQRNKSQVAKSKKEGTPKRGSA